MIGQYKNNALVLGFQSSIAGRIGSYATNKATLEVIPSSIEWKSTAIDFLYEITNQEAYMLLLENNLIFSFLVNELHASISTAFSENKLGRILLTAYEDELLVTITSFDKLEVLFDKLSMLMSKSDGLKNPSINKILTVTIESLNP
jgi:hypothetical protein